MLGWKAQRFAFHRSCPEPEEKSEKITLFYTSKTEHQIGSACSCGSPRNLSSPSSSSSTHTARTQHAHSTTRSTQTPHPLPFLRSIHPVRRNPLRPDPAQFLLEEPTVAATSTAGCRYLPVVSLPTHCTDLSPPLLRPYLISLSCRLVSSARGSRSLPCAALSSVTTWFEGKGNLIQQPDHRTAPHQHRTLPRISPSPFL